jgi:hypothetical protein
MDQLTAKITYAFYDLAISFELTGNNEASISAYEGVSSIISENPNAKSKSFIEWSEEALYRATLLGLREGYAYV